MIIQKLYAMEKAGFAEKAPMALSSLHSRSAHGDKERQIHFFHKTLNNYRSKLLDFPDCFISELQPVHFSRLFFVRKLELK